MSFLTVSKQIDVPQKKRATFGQDLWLGWVGSGGYLALSVYPIMLSRHDIVNWGLNLAPGIC